MKYSHHIKRDKDFNVTEYSVKQDGVYLGCYRYNTIGDIIYGEDGEGNFMTVEYDRHNRIIRYDFSDVSICGLLWEVRDYSETEDIYYRSDGTESHYDKDGKHLFTI